MNGIYFLVSEMQCLPFSRSHSPFWRRSLLNPVIGGALFAITDSGMGVNRSDDVKSCRHRKTAVPAHSPLIKMNIVRVESWYAAEGARLYLTLRLISAPLRYVVRQSNTIFCHLSALF
jgi:hypothetical protein